MWLHCLHTEACLNTFLLVLICWWWKLSTNLVNRTHYSFCVTTVWSGRTRWRNYQLWHIFPFWGEVPCDAWQLSKKASAKTHVFNLYPSTARDCIQDIFTFNVYSQTELDARFIRFVGQIVCEGQKWAFVEGSSSTMAFVPGL